MLLWVTFSDPMKSSVKTSLKISFPFPMIPYMAKQTLKLVCIYDTPFSSWCIYSKLEDCARPIIMADSGWSDNLLILAWPVHNLRLGGGVELDSRSNFSHQSPGKVNQIEIPIPSTYKLVQDFNMHLVDFQFKRKYSTSTDHNCSIPK